MTKWLKWAGWPLGIALFIALIVRQGAADVVRVIGQAGPVLLWLVPFHALPLLLDAYGWRVLLRGRAPLVFLWWVATVREAVSRLLPVVAVGGEIVGIRLARWRVRDASCVSASVIVEVLVTIAVQYAFSALGVVLILAATGGGHARTIGLALILSLPLPVITALLLRRGGVFRAIERFAARALGSEHRFLQGIDGARLDAEIDALMTRTGVLLSAFGWQFAGYLIGAFETYWALALLGHPVSIGGAVAIEALTQAVRHAAFMVPAGLGVQEVAVVLLAQMFGIDREVGLSLALVKRMREVVFGCIALGSWQLAELVRARRYASTPAMQAEEAEKAAAPAASTGERARGPSRDFDLTR